MPDLHRRHVQSSCVTFRIREPADLRACGLGVTGSGGSAKLAFELVEVLVPRPGLMWKSEVAVVGVPRVTKMMKSESSQMTRRLGFGSAPVASVLGVLVGRWLLLSIQFFRLKRVRCGNMTAPFKCRVICVLGAEPEGFPCLVRGITEGPAPHAYLNSVVLIRLESYRIVPLQELRGLRLAGPPAGAVHPPCAPSFPPTRWWEPSDQVVETLCCACAPMLKVWWPSYGQAWLVLLPWAARLSQVSSLGACRAEGTNCHYDYYRIQRHYQRGVLGLEDGLTQLLKYIKEIDGETAYRIAP